jgi:large subunit ribosomal protein L23
MDIVIKKPLITEKSMKMAAVGVYTFLVDKDARKPLIAKTIAEKFSVDVLSIKTVNYKDEARMQRSRRGSFTIPGFKKAIVHLKKGQKIALFETEKSQTEEETKEEVKEKKSLLKGTKVKIEKVDDKKTTKKGKKEEETK